MSDAVVIQLVSAVSSLIGTAVTGYLGYLIARQTIQQKTHEKIQEQQANLTATHMRAVSLAMDRAIEANAGNVHKIRAIAIEVKAIHVIVRNNAAEQLRINRLLSRRIADLTGYPGDIRMAELLEEVEAPTVGRPEDIAPIMPEDQS